METGIGDIALQGGIAGAAGLGAIAATQKVSGAVGGVRQALRLGRPATLLKPNPMRAQVVSRVQQRLLRAPKLAGREFERGLDDIVNANLERPATVSDLGSEVQFLTRVKGKQYIEKGSLQSINENTEQAIIRHTEIPEYYSATARAEVAKYGSDVIQVKLKDLSVPAPRVDLTSSLVSYLEKAKSNPAFRSLIERQALNNQESGLVQSLLNQPEVAARLTLKDSQTVKQIFQRVNKQRFQQVDPEFFGAHLDALEVWHDIRLAQLQAFPQFKSVLQGYAEAMKNFRIVKNMLKEGALEPQLLSNLSENSERIRAFRELATPDTMRMVERFLKANSTRNFLKRLGIGAITTVGAGAGLTGGGIAIAKLFGVGRE